MKNKTKIFLAIMILMVGVLAAEFVLAVGDQATTGASATTAGADPVTVVGNFYKLALMVSGFLAFAMIVFGAFKYTIAAGNPSGQSDAKDTILQALLGLLLLLGAYIILQTINPAILSTKIPGLEPLQAPAQNQSSLPGTNCSDSACVSEYGPNYTCAQGVCVQKGQTNTNGQITCSEPDGTACSGGAPGGVGLYCFNDVCVSATPTGNSCDPTQDLNCTNGGTCVNGMCWTGTGIKTSPPPSTPTFYWCVNAEGVVPGTCSKTKGSCSSDSRPASGTSCP